MEQSRRPGPHHMGSSPPSRTSRQSVWTASPAVASAMGSSRSFSSRHHPGLWLASPRLSNDGPRLAA